MPFTRTNLSRTPARAASHMWLGDQQHPPGSLNVANVVYEQLLLPADTALAWNSVTSNDYILAEDGYTSDNSMPNITLPQ